MKRLLFFTSVLVCACSSGNQSTATDASMTDSATVDISNFEIKNDVISMNTTINGTDTINAIFDTGALLYYSLNKSDYDRLFPDYQRKNSMEMFDSTRVNSINIVGFDYLGKEIISVNFESLFGPRYEVDYRMWSMDMENRVLSINDSIDDSQYPLIYKLFFHKRGDKRIAPFVNIPISFTNGKDSINTDWCYLLDTGTPFSFEMTDPTDNFIDFADNSNPHKEIDIWMSDKMKDKKMTFTADYSLDGSEYQHNDMKIDIYTGVRSIRSEFRNIEKINGGKRVVGTIGTQFLKNYNFVIDLKNERLLLKPVKTNFPSLPIVRNDFRVDKNNKVYKKKYGAETNVSLNDSVVSANGKAWVDYSKREQDSLLSVAKDVEWVFEK